MDGHPANRHPRLLALLGAVLALALAALLAANAGPERAEAGPRPNVVVIQTDDQSMRQFFATYVLPDGSRAPVMPRLLTDVGEAGILFKRYYVSYPTCCPSRATLLSGRYAHSHGVLGNRPPGGAYPSYRNHAIFRHNLAVWLQRAGYRTFHFGKFLNVYGELGPDGAPEEEVPPGWNRWVTDATDYSTRRFYGYLLNLNGQIRGPFGNPEYGRGENVDDITCGPLTPLELGCNYQTDAMTRRALDRIYAAAPGGPFYLQLDYIAPHGDHRLPIGPEPAPRHYGSADATPLPRPAGLFNEGNISDKPGFIRDQAPYLDAASIRRVERDYRKGLESLRAVDEGIGAIVDALRETGELNNTYIFVTSDNGFFYGEHRLERSKFLPYEPAVHEPLFVRGPGIQPGSESRELVSNIDLTPTILQLTGARADRSMDGRSMVPFLADPALRTRRAVLLESFARATDLEGPNAPGGEPPAPSPRDGRAHASIAAPVEDYLGIRIGPYKYVEYRTGDRELYDLSRDHKELVNRVDDPRYDRLRRRLRLLLAVLENCRGSECRFKPGPLPPVGRFR